MKRECYRLEEIANITNAEIGGDPKHLIKGFSDLESATSDDLSFLHNPNYQSTRYVTAMKQSLAGAIFIAPDAPRVDGKNYLIHTDPSLAFQKAIEFMIGGVPKVTYFEGVHPTATIHPTAQIGVNVFIGPNVVIDGEVTIGDDSAIHAGTYIGPKTSIGTQTIIHPNVTVKENCHIGKHVVIQSGAVIGSIGFGFTTDDKGCHTRLSHIGRVEIADHVEIGANAIIDRARFTLTKIGKGSKLDGAVMVGHNVEIGENSLLCGQAGIAGSTKIGDRVIIAGQVGIEGHIKLTNDVMIAAKSGVSKSITKPGRYGGIPVQSIGKYNRNTVLLRNIESIIEKLKKES